MKTNKIILSTKYYSLNKQLNPGIQIQNFFRVDHNSKFQQNPLRISNKNTIATKPGSHHYEILYSSRSKSKDRDSDNSCLSKPKIIINNLPPEFNINTNSNNTNTNNNTNDNNYITKNGYEKVINNFLIGAKTDIKSKENNLHFIKNMQNSRLSYTSNDNISKNETNINNSTSNNNITNNNLNHYNTEGSELDNLNQDISSIGFKSFNIISIKNRGKTALKYNRNDYYNGNLSEIAEIINKKNGNKSQKRNGKENSNKINIVKISEENKRLKNYTKNGIRPIKINNYNNNFQRKVIPPIMHKFDKINFDSESMFSFKKSQLSNLNNFNYSKLQKNNSNSNINLMEKEQGKTFSNFKNGIRYNLDMERKIKSFSGKNINEESSKKKSVSRPNSEDNNKTNFETNNNNNDYNNEKEIINKKIQELLIYKKSPNNLNSGLFYKLSNGYKFYFDLNNIDCYIFKEIEINSNKNNILKLIETWQKKYRKFNHYLKILGFKKFNSQKNFNIILEYPTGGENFNDIINSIGFYDVKLLLNISQIIYECLSKIKNDKGNNNINFCICDIYVNINNHIKIIPPFIRNIQTNKSTCKCKLSINKFKNIFNYNDNDISLFCFGFILLQLITQNLIFKIKSFNYLIKAEKEKYILCFKKCCLIHTLINIEEKMCDKKKDLLLSNFLKLYPECVTNFAHICTQFNSLDNLEIIYKHEFLNMYDARNHTDVHFKEILKILNFDSKYNNNPIKYDDFLTKFELIYNKLEINQYVFGKVFRYKILNNLIRAFNLNDKKEVNKLLNKLFEN